MGWRTETPIGRQSAKTGQHSARKTTEAVLYETLIASVIIGVAE
jgi:hypothetical protein